MDKNKLFQQFVQFTASVHQVTNDMTKEIKIDNITSVQYKILEYITVSQPVTLSEISECLHLSLPNSSRELKKLIEKQLCEKIIDPNDRRKYDIRLTENGTELMNKVFQQLELKFQAQINNLSEPELKEIEEAINILQKKFFS
ncbi:MarR family winged helix-turn-helix transcriptional regulator [Evansella cellulosilytica]|uniref:Transcriptional regulator, MarR family n=1 Tax=Evansella cellulosilytica (strain ATCC 21833 / DSM 2522 / FERM P-1141 / JCM 9156 / N-4) TaxID=649639 RepID=E6U0Q1_EVAC2|nr:MarR family transcriptional regulator [Evansella cellulosilytica]ADU29099.1 transcriptional regulator, MarR family [Evansella cellulosilytica DSM 2522]